MLDGQLHLAESLAAQLFCGRSILHGIRAFCNAKTDASNYYLRAKLDCVPGKTNLQLATPNQRVRTMSAPVVFSNIVGTPATPQFAEVVYNGSMVMSNGLSKPIVQIYHFRQDQTPVATVMADLIATLKTFIDPALGLALSDAYVAGSVTGRWMDDPTVAAESFSNDVVGSITGDRATGFNAVTVRLATAGRGRNYRGSKHFAPIAETDTLKDDLNTTPLTRWQTVATDLTLLKSFADADGQQFKMIVLSRNLSDLTANPSVFSGADLTLATANKRVGRMIRRQERASVAIG